MSDIELSGARHLAILEFSPELMLFIQDETFKVDHHGLPEGVSIVGRGYDPQRDVFYLTLNHPSFPLVLAGSCISRLPPITICRIST